PLPAGETRLPAPNRLLLRRRSLFSGRDRLEALRQFLRVGSDLLLEVLLGRSGPCELLLSGHDPMGFRGLLSRGRLPLFLLGIEIPLRGSKSILFATQIQSALPQSRLEFVQGRFLLRQGLFSLRQGCLASCELATGTLDRLRFRGQLEARRVEIFSGSFRFLSGPIERGLSLSDLGMGLRRSGLSFLEVRLRRRQRFFPSFDRRVASVHFGQGGLVRFGGGSERLLPFVEGARLAFESCLRLRGLRNLLLERRLIRPQLFVRVGQGRAGFLELPRSSSELLLPRL